MGKAKKTAPQRAGREKVEKRFARVMQAVGSDPASLMLAIAIMERVLSRPRRRSKKSNLVTKHRLTS